jgi:pimeloyl-ACP methyl ester carboxylesterase
MTGATNTAVEPAPAPATEVRLTTSDRVEIAASYWKAGDPTAPAILLLHGNGGNRRDMLDMATWLAGEGYSVLSIDIRGHGRSSPESKSFGYLEARDAHTALAWIRQQHPASKVGAIGFSLGGAASVLGEEGPLDVDALVMMSVYPDIRTAIFNRIEGVAGTLPATAIEPLLSYQTIPRYGVWPDELSPIAALKEVRIPVMLVGGERDAHTPPSEIEAMYDAAPPGSEWWILGGLGHDDVVRSADPALRGKLKAYLDRNLGR